MCALQICIIIIIIITIINDAKASYYRDKISTCSDQKEPFKIVEQLRHQKEKSINFPLTILKQNWQRNLTSSLFPNSPQFA